MSKNIAKKFLDNVKKDTQDETFNSNEPMYRALDGLVVLSNEKNLKGLIPETKNDNDSQKISEQIEKLREQLSDSKSKKQSYKEEKTLLNTLSGDVSAGDYIKEKLGINKVSNKLNEKKEKLKENLSNKFQTFKDKTGISKVQRGMKKISELNEERENKGVFGMIRDRKVDKRLASENTEELESKLEAQISHLEERLSVSTGESMGADSLAEYNTTNEESNSTTVVNNIFNKDVIEKVKEIIQEKNIFEVKDEQQLVTNITEAIKNKNYKNVSEIDSEINPISTSIKSDNKSGTKASTNISKTNISNNMSNMKNVAGDTNMFTSDALGKEPLSVPEFDMKETDNLKNTDRTKLLQNSTKTSDALEAIAKTLKEIKKGLIDKQDTSIDFSKKTSGTVDTEKKDIDRPQVKKMDDGEGGSGFLGGMFDGDSRKKGRKGRGGRGGSFNAGGGRNRPTSRFGQASRKARVMGKRKYRNTKNSVKNKWGGAKDTVKNKAGGFLDTVKNSKAGKFISAGAGKVAGGVSKYGGKIAKGASKYGGKIASGVSKYGGKVAKGASGMLKGGAKGVSKFIPGAAALASGAFAVADYVGADNDSERIDAVAGGVGGMAGGAAGALAGAAIGSVIPVFGTAIGGIVGGIAGSMLGEAGMKSLGNMFKDGEDFVSDDMKNKSPQEKKMYLQQQVIPTMQENGDDDSIEKIGKYITEDLNPKIAEEEQKEKDKFVKGHGDKDMKPEEVQEKLPSWLPPEQETELFRQTYGDMSKDSQKDYKMWAEKSGDTTALTNISNFESSMSSAKQSIPELSKGKLIPKGESLMGTDISSGSMMIEKKGSTKGNINIDGMSKKLSEPKDKNSKGLDQSHKKMIMGQTQEGGGKSEVLTLDDFKSDSEIEPILGYMIGMK